MPKNSLIIAIVVVAVLIVAGIITGILLSTKGGNENNNPGNQSGIQVVDNSNQQTGNAGTEGSGTGGTDSSDTDNANTETPQTYSIDIANFAFSPSEIRIKAGDTVVWTNKDSTRHTVTSDSGSELGSALLSGEESYSHTFSTTGTFSYHCSPHPYMKGKIIVE